MASFRGEVGTGDWVPEREQGLWLAYAWVTKMGELRSGEASVRTRLPNEKSLRKYASEID